VVTLHETTPRNHVSHRPPPPSDAAKQCLSSWLSITASWGRMIAGTWLLPSSVHTVHSATPKKQVRRGPCYPDETNTGTMFPTIHHLRPLHQTTRVELRFLDCIVRPIDRSISLDRAHHAHGAPNPVNVAHVPPRETRFPYHTPPTHLASSKTLSLRPSAP